MVDRTPEYMRLLMNNEEKLFRFIQPLVGRYADAQEVMQETAIALWQKFSEYDASKPFLPWAKSFARYKVLMHHRQRSQHPACTSALIDVLIEDQEAEADTIEARRRHALAGCIERLQ